MNGVMRESGVTQSLEKHGANTKKKHCLRAFLMLSIR